jgi:hypothetical protein
MRALPTSPSRRVAARFLATAALGAVLATVLPAQAAHADRFPPARHRLGQISLGGATHAAVRHGAPLSGSALRAVQLLNQRRALAPRPAALTSARLVAGADLVAGGPAATAAVLTPKSTWQVSYSGFTPSAQSAFQAAVDIWAGIISSPVPIKVSATFAATSPGLLGYAGASQSYSGGGLGDGTSYYPSALADALAGEDVASLLGLPYADIDATFSSSEPSFYFGTDGNPPSGKIDFESVVLHELGHGLGFAGGMTVSGSTGTEQAPLVFDNFAVAGAGTALQSLAGSSLASALTGGSVSWAGAQGKAANGGVNPKLYAPATWEAGSSFSHLDESTYPAGSANALMTPYIQPQEVLRSPGPLVAGILRDMGWTASLATVPGAPGAVSASPLDSAAWVSWTPAAANGATVTGYTVTASPGGASATTDGTTTAVAVPGLSNGSPYTVTVTATNSVGTGPASAASAPVTPSSVDSVAPALGLLAKPASATKLTSAAFTFAGVDYGRPSALLTYRCGLDGAPLTGCVSGQSYLGLAQGVHTFSAQVLDEALNASPVTTYTWRVDTTAPTVSASALPLWTLASSLTLGRSGSDVGGSGIAGYTYQRKAAASGGSFGAVSYATSPTWTSLAKGVTYCMSARAQDKAGNLSAWSPWRCSATPLDDRSLSAATGWVRSSGSAYANGTVTVTSKSGIALTRSSVQARRLAVVATTCSACGSLNVYFNGVLIKTLSLVSATTKHRQVFTVKDFGSVKSGTVVIKSASTRSVYVDGLGVTRV